MLSSMLLLFTVKCLESLTRSPEAMGRGVKIIPMHTTWAWTLSLMSSHPSKEL